MSDVTERKPADVKKMLKTELLEFALQMLSEYNMMAVGLDCEIREGMMADAMIMDRDRTIQLMTITAKRDAEHLLRKNGANRGLSRDLQDMHAECGRHQDSIARLRKQLREEQQAHQKTRDKVKTAPRIKIESTALVEMSKNGKAADSNLSEMFGDCDVTVTAPKKEERRPRRGVEDLMSVLGKGSGMFGGPDKGKGDLFSDMISTSIAHELAKSGETSCPVCHGTNPFCEVDKMLRAKAAVSNCPFGNPSHMCEDCMRDYDCKFRGMDQDTIEMMTSESGASNLRDILTMMSAGNLEDKSTDLFDLGGILKISIGPEDLSFGGSHPKL